MAAYAALCSLMHTIDQIHHHPRPPISIDMEQYESLTENITFLLGFLECHSYGGNREAVERRIEDAAYAAEDIIESQIVDEIHARRSSVYGENRAIKLCEGLGEVMKNMEFLKIETMEMEVQDQIRGRQFTVREKIIGCFQFFLTLCISEERKVIKNMEFLKKDKMKIKEEMAVQDQLQPASSSRSRPTTTGKKKNIMVSFDEVLIEVLDKLTRGRTDRQIIPIVGMGGVGKTTLAQNMYVNPLVEQYFDIHAWATISQQYSMREILSEIVGQLNQKHMKSSNEMTDNELGETLYKHLWSRRYLIVIDDMWRIDAWDKIKFFFPECNNGSRIVVTTRLSNLASQLTGSSYSLVMKLLDEVKSWNLFCETVFEEEGGCPCELEEIGKEITKNCRGLPLSIVVVGRLLAKSKHTREYWEYIAGQLKSILNMKDDERCFKILYMSYNQLPVHLKPCFLYMGVYPEDHAIRVSELTKLWAVEGFIRPISGKCLEGVAKEYLEDLVNRNLIIVHKLGSIGNIKHIKIHDLLRDLCMREAHNDRFYHVTSQPTVNAPKGIRRHVFPGTVPSGAAFQSSTAVIRTLVWRVIGVVPSLDLKFLRIFKGDDQDSWRDGTNFNDLENVLQYVNLRYLNTEVRYYRTSTFPPSSFLLWNLQTLSVRTQLTTNMIKPMDIWKMPQLRHVKVESLCLPGDDEQDVVILCNLQTLGTLRDLKSSELVKRIPNIKKLKINHEICSVENYLNGFDSLQKLESLYYRVQMHNTDFLPSINFPHSLKKLTLIAYGLQLEDIMDKIGSLPLLEKFKWCFHLRTWETVEGQFRSLKFLKISSADLESWKTESTHFPRLERLVLVRLGELKEIPSDIGEIPMLQSIKLKNCSDTAIISAKTILEQQEELGEVGLQVRVRTSYENDATIQNLASHNFQFDSDY